LPSAYHPVDCTMAQASSRRKGTQCYGCAPILAELTLDFTSPGHQGSLGPLCEVSLIAIADRAGVGFAALSIAYSSDHSPTVFQGYSTSLAYRTPHAMGFMESLISQTFHFRRGFLHINSLPGSFGIFLLDVLPNGSGVHLMSTCSRRALASPRSTTLLVASRMTAIVLPSISHRLELAIDVLPCGLCWLNIFGTTPPSLCFWEVFLMKLKVPNSERGTRRSPFGLYRNMNTRTSKYRSSILCHRTSEETLLR
jgi:hypothetical protein